MKEYDKCREEIVEKINKAQDEINSLKEDITSNKSAIEDIKVIAYKLKEIEAALKPKEKWFKQKIDSLNLIIKELSKIRSDIILTTTDEIFEIIDKNLLDGMYLESVDDNRHLKNIMFDEEEVGSVEVLEDNIPEIRIRVTVYDSSDDFEIRDAYRMYSIISFINTKFNYKETK